MGDLNPRPKTHPARTAGYSFAAGAVVTAVGLFLVGALHVGLPLFIIVALVVVALIVARSARRRR